MRVGVRKGYKRGLKEGSRKCAGQYDPTLFVSYILPLLSTLPNQVDPNDKDDTCTSICLICKTIITKRLSSHLRDMHGYQKKYNAWKVFSDLKKWQEEMIKKEAEKKDKDKKVSWTKQSERGPEILTDSLLSDKLSYRIVSYRIVS